MVISTTFLLFVVAPLLGAAWALWWGRRAVLAGLGRATVVTARVGVFTLGMGAGLALSTARTLVARRRALPAVDEGKILHLPERPPRRAA